MRKMILVIVLCLLSTGVYAETFFRTSGQEILDPDGNAYLARGLVLSGWLIPEAYGLKINEVHNRHMNAYTDLRERIREILGNDADTNLFWDTYHSNYVTEADIATFAAQGFNTIRIPFNYRLLSPQDTPGVYSEEGFQVLDTIIQWCKNHGLSVLLDMHACPGGQSHDAYADPEHSYWYYDSGRQEWIEHGVAVFWENNQDYYNATGRTSAFNKQRTADIWRTIADRYKNETALLGYELINEPYFYESSGVTVQDMRDAFIQITNAIREVDINHIIFVEGNIFAEFIDGLTPPWDDNMVIAFHRYWRETGYADGQVQKYLDARSTHNVPLLLTESGENSHPWFYEIKELMESNNIGWFFWGFKKVDGISTAYEVQKTPDYQYVIDNFRDGPIDPVRAKKGLMELAENVKTANCLYKPGFFASLLDPQFNLVPKSFTAHNLPGIIYASDYDVGNQNVAYSDTRYKNEEYMGEAWNYGWVYRSDGVDIVKTSDGNGYKVGYTDDGEWLKYTVNIFYEGKYNINIRVATPEVGRELQLRLDGTDLTSVLALPQTSGWDDWQDLTASNISLPSGTHILELRIIKGGFDISSVEFTMPSSNLIINGGLSGISSTPTNWSNWNDGSHDPDTTTYRGSTGNSWVFWWDGGIYQNVTAGFSVGDELMFGGYLYMPGWDALRNGSKYGVIEIEFYAGDNSLISTASASPAINSSSAVNTWIPVTSSVIVPVGAAKVRLVIRCNDCASGDGRFMVDDVYIN